MSMYNDEMVIDVANFDFSQIDDSSEPVENRVQPVEEYEDGDEDEFDLFGEEEEDEVSDIEEDDESGEEVDDITGALAKLDTIPDDFELDFGNTKVAKGELVELLGAREEVIKSRAAIENFANVLVDREKAVTVAFEVAKTETEKQLEHVYRVLNDPNKWDGSVDVAGMQKARIQLEARKKDLDAKAEAAQTAIAEQKQQVAIFNIQKVVKEMGSQEPLTEAAKYAESKGINLEAVINGLSPAMVTMMNNAKKYEDLVNKNKTRLETAAKQKRPRSTSTKTQTSQKGKVSEKARAMAAMKAGKLSPSEMYQFLED